MLGIQVHLEWGSKILSDLCGGELRSNLKTTMGEVSKNLIIA